MDSLAELYFVIYGKGDIDLLLPVKKCRGGDLNSRTSTGTDLESVAVDLAWLPLRKEGVNNLMIIKV